MQKKVTEIEGVINFIQSGFTDLKSYILVFTILLIWFVIQYFMKHLPKHRELNQAKNKNKLTNLKDLGEIDWNIINEGKSLYIQYILKETFGKALTIQEFISLSKYPNTIEVISLFLKYKRFYYLNPLTANVEEKPSVFDKSLKVYNKTWSNLLATVMFTLVSALLTAIVLYALEKQEFTPSTYLTIALLTSASLFCFVMVVLLGYIAGQTKDAHKSLEIFAHDKKIDFPLPLSK